MKSKITNGETKYLFTAKVLGKYDVKYYQCKDTGFMQTEEPFWLNEAYSSAITSLDLGILYRNIKLTNAVIPLINNFFDSGDKFLDYAGGYGIFTRLMRDNGYNYFHHDQYCENLFAKHFELENVNSNKHFEVATSFELFEHLANPLKEISTILNYSDSILFTTELVPDKAIASSLDWWYIVPETGQHIAFYTRKSLEEIAKKLQLQLFSNNTNFHLLTRKKSIDSGIEVYLRNPFEEKKPAKTSFFKRLFRPSVGAEKAKPKDSLLQQDFNYVKELISRKLL